MGALQMHDQSWPMEQKGPAELPSRSQRCSLGHIEEDQACEVKWQDGQSKLR